MIVRRPGAPLEWVELPDPQPGPSEIRVRVMACGVCRTDLHVIDGELPGGKLPIIPGHEIVGRIDALGADVEGLALGHRVGIPWLGHTCGRCMYCRSGAENLCDRPLFTGFTRNGGYATFAVADARYAFPLGESGSDVALAPLLCAGLIGWRSLVMAGEGRKLGLYGFGAAAHIMARSLAGPPCLCIHPERRRADPGFCPQPGGGMGRRFGRNSAPSVGRRHHFCPGWGSGSAGAESGAQRRPRCLRRNSYERHSRLFL